MGFKPLPKKEQKTERVSVYFFISWNKTRQKRNILIKFYLCNMWFLTWTFDLVRKDQRLFVFLIRHKNGCLFNSKSAYLDIRKHFIWCESQWHDSCFGQKWQDSEAVFWYEQKKKLNYRVAAKFLKWNLKFHKTTILFHSKDNIHITWKKIVIFINKMIIKKH